MGLSMANETARALRKRMTPHEIKLWVQLRLLRDQGLHFRRQVPIGPYIVDFAERKHRLVIEVDGSQHGFETNLLADQKRDADLTYRNFRVLRFWNCDVDQAMDGVIDKILDSSREPHPSPPQVLGREK